MPLKTSSFFNTLAATLILFATLPAVCWPQNPIGERYTSWRADASSSIPGTWHFLGPRRYVPGPAPEAQVGGLGRVLDVAPHPEDPETLFAATGSGVWISRQGGQSWKSLNRHLVPVPSVSSLAFDPDDPDTLFALTGSGVPANVNFIPSSGVLKWTDGSWRPLPLPWGSNELHSAQKIIVPRGPSCDAILVATAAGRAEGAGGLFRSVDGGQTWKRTSRSPAETNASFRDLEIHPTLPHILYAASERRVYRSKDCGESWELLSDGLPEPDDVLQRIEIAVSPASPDTVYTIFADNGGFAGTFHSRDRGDHFTLRSDSRNILSLDQFGLGAESIAWYALGFAVSPCDAEELHVGSFNAWRSFDGGVTWSRTAFWQEKELAAQPSNYIHVDVQRLVFAPHTSTCSADSAKPPTLFAATDGGLFMSVDRAEAWYDLSANLAITEVYRLCGSGEDLDLLYLGCQDIGTNRLVNGLAIHVFGGDGTYCMIDPSDHRMVYISYQWGKLFRSNDGAHSFIDRTPSRQRPITGGHLGILWPFALEPGRPSTVYGCYPNALWRSTDRGQSWVSLGSPQYDVKGDAASRCVGLAVSEGGETILTATSRKVSLYDGTTRAWSEVTPPQLGDAEVASVAIYSNRHLQRRELFVLYKRRHARHGEERASGVLHSLDNGTTWEHDSNGLPDVAADTLHKVIRGAGGISPGLYLGMDIGVYFRPEETHSWRQLGRVGGGDGELPAVPVMAIDFQSNGDRGRLRVGTLGWGVWEFIPHADSSDTDSSDKRTSQASFLRQPPNPSQAQQPSSQPDE